MYVTDTKFNVMSNKSIEYILIISHVHYPTEMLKSYNLSYTDRYNGFIIRGIYLFSSICKIYDYLIIELCHDFFFYQ